MNPEPTIRLAILASGTGTNAEAIIRYFEHHRQAKVVLLLSNNPEAGALKIAADHQVASRSFTREQWNGEDVIELLREFKVTHIALAGFLWLVPSRLILAFNGKVINIHPSLLPKYGGKGMYGRIVHEAVKRAGEKETGITIHEVNEQFDKGKVLFQKSCIVDEKDTVDEIERKVRELELRHYPEVIKNWVHEF